MLVLFHVQRVLKSLHDIARNMGGHNRIFEDKALQQRLLSLSSEKDPIVRSLATAIIKDLVQYGISFPHGEHSMLSNCSCSMPLP